MSSKFVDDSKLYIRIYTKLIWRNRIGQMVSIIEKLFLNCFSEGCRSVMDMHYLRVLKEFSSI